MAKSKTNSTEEETVEVEKETKEENLSEKNDNAPDFDTEKYFQKIYYDEMQKIKEGQPEKGDKSFESLISKERFVLRPEFNSRLIKCQIRTARRFNVPLEHLKDAVSDLNGKKLDGYIINHIIGRYGYYDPDKQINRSDLAVYTKTSVMQLEIAEEKLAAIIKRADVKRAYNEYTELLTTESKKEIKDLAKFGG
jgi:hypothetical protein